MPKVQKRNSDSESEKTEEPQLYSMWAVPKYDITKERIMDTMEMYDLDKKIQILEKTDKGYHDRIDPTKQYKFFGDCDNYKGTIDKFIELLITFLDQKYAIKVNKDAIMYTENKKKKGSYHYSIPSLNASVKKLKEVHTNFKKMYTDEFVNVVDGKAQNVIDTSIYSVHWFRCPNQSKEGDKDTKHRIVKGQMKDFIIDHVEPTSLNIDDRVYLKESRNGPKKQPPVKQEANDQQLVIPVSPTVTTTTTTTTIIQNEVKDNIVALVQHNEQTILYRFFDECFAQKRFDTYEYWMRVGMAIKNKFGNDGFAIFQYFSNKGAKPDPADKLLSKYNTFKETDSTPITIKTIYYYAKEDNLAKYIEIVKTQSMFKGFEVNSVMISKYIHMLRPNDFIWKDDLLYCYNGKFWEQSDLLLKIYIGNELFYFLRDVLVTCFWAENPAQFQMMKNSLNMLRRMSFKEEIVKTTKEDFRNNKVQFDTKWYLFGFENTVFDLRAMKFREYEYDDYVTLTAGYDWVEPSDAEIQTMQKLIESIHPVEEERQLFLEIVSTGLEGRCLEKFIVLNAKGGNGKSMLNDLILKSYGQYSLIGNNALLFEKSRTGTNPEKNNIHKKRYVVFREPSSTGKIENSVMKELTGGGGISVRGHYESKTEKKLHCTIVMESNNRPLFAEEPKEAESRRIIDIYFRRIFTDKKELVDEENGIFLANRDYKNEDFQEKHKTALFVILVKAYEKYMERGYHFIIPKSVADRTNQYLEMSSNILTWVNDGYDRTANKTDIVKLCDMYDHFKVSDYYSNLTKAQRLRYNKSYFMNEIADNAFLKQYYAARKHIDGQYYNNVLTNHKRKDEAKNEFANDLD